MTTTLRFQGPGLEPFEVDLSDDEFAWLEAYRRAKGLTLDQVFEHVVQNFIATHPIIAQTRTPQ